MWTERRKEREEREEREETEAKLCLYEGEA
jgi:hypothetical protein